MEKVDVDIDGKKGRSFQGKQGRSKEGHWSVFLVTMEDSGSVEGY